MCDLHPDLAKVTLSCNDPYLGNSHPADHTILVPVFVEDMHLFTVCAKAHQADIGNSLPTTYHATAQDVYEEGALISPCVRVQRDRRDIEDIIRICRALSAWPNSGTATTWRRWAPRASASAG